MKHYNLLLFDFDNTLIDFSEDQKLALKFVFEKIGHNYSDEVLEYYNKINEIVWEKLENGKIKTIDELYEQRCKMLFEKFNINETTDKFNHLLDVGFQRNGTPFLGVSNVLKRLSERFKLGIITNGPKSQQYVRLKNAGISQYFSYVFVSEEIGYNKPNIKFFEYVFEKIIEKDKDKILVIGDSLTSDIQGGINAGLDTCWYNANNVGNMTAIKPTYEVKELEELMHLLIRKI